MITVKDYQEINRDAESILRIMGFKPATNNFHKCLIAAKLMFRKYHKK